MSPVTIAQDLICYILDIKGHSFGALIGAHKGQWGSNQTFNQSLGPFSCRMNVYWLENNKFWCIQHMSQNHDFCYFCDLA